MNTDRIKIPLLAPKHISQFSPTEYRQYMRSLWIDPATTRKAKARGPIQYLTGTTTKKGSLVIRCKRSPKQVTYEEVDTLRESLSMSHLQVWAALRKRKIKIVQKIIKLKID